MKKSNGKKIYPALSHKMGYNPYNDEHYWTTYTTRMSLKEVAENIITPGEYSITKNNKQLRLMYQRKIRLNRVIKIAEYMRDRPDRIFGPLIVAIIGAKTNFISNSDMDDYVSPNGSSSGWFEIDDSEDANYVSIDGQHRLAAIRIITDTDIGSLTDENYEPLSDSKIRNLRKEFSNNPLTPKSLIDEEITVSFLPRPDEESDVEKFIEYRKVFISINRHAKTTVAAENIIMEEVDGFARTLQSLTETHDFFYQLNDKELLSMRTSINDKDPSFMTIESLYKFLQTVLRSKTRQNSSDYGNGGMKSANKYKDTIQSESHLQQLLYESTAIWDVLLKLIPEMHDGNELPLKSYKDLRSHDNVDNENIEDNYLWLRPIGISLLASIVRKLLDEYANTELLENIYVEDNDEQTQKNFKECKDDLEIALSPLSSEMGMEWDMSKAPWKGLYINYDPLSGNSKRTQEWKMTSAERTKIHQIAEDLASYIFSYGNFDGYPDTNHPNDKVVRDWQNALRLNPDNTGDDLIELEKLEALVSKIQQNMADSGMFDDRSITTT